MLIYSGASLRAASAFDITSFSAASGVGARVRRGTIPGFPDEQPVVVILAPAITAVGGKRVRVTDSSDIVWMQVLLDDFIDSG